MRGRPVHREGGRGSLSRYLWGHTITVAGNWAQIVVIIVLAKDLGASGFLIGAVGACRQLPQLIIGPMVGGYLDRWDLKRAIVWTQAVSGALVALLAGLVAADVIGLTALAGFAIVLGLLNVIDNPARLALVGSLVPAEEMSKAMAYVTTASAAARVSGPGVAALGLLLAAPWAVFAADAASYAIGAVLFARIVLPGGFRVTAPTREDVPTDDGAPPGEDTLASAAAPPPAVTTRTILSDPVLRSTLILVLAATVCALNIQVVLVLLVTDTLGQSDQVYSWLLAVIGLSGVVGALRARRVEAPTTRLVATISVIVGASVAVAGVVRPVVATGLALAVGGVAGGMLIALSMSLVQRAAPEGGRGRTMAIHTAVFSGAAPLAGLVGGALSDGFGPPFAMVLLGMTLVLVAVVGTRPGRDTQHTLTAGAIVR